MTVHYHGDGSGRDTYVINNDGGLHSYDYRSPHEFGKNLRYVCSSDIRIYLNHFINIGNMNELTLKREEIFRILWLQQKSHLKTHLIILQIKNIETSLVLMTIRNGIIHKTYLNLNKQALFNKNLLSALPRKNPVKNIGPLSIRRQASLKSRSL